VAAARVQATSTDRNTSRRTRSTRPASSGHPSPFHVPAGTFGRALETVDWSPVEPQFERKYYVAGIGEVAERVTQGGHEHFALVSVTR